jgi:hypothetical protein
MWSRRRSGEVVRGRERGGNDEWVFWSHTALHDGLARFVYRSRAPIATGSRGGTRGRPVWTPVNHLLTLAAPWNRFVLNS